MNRSTGRNHGQSVPVLYRMIHRAKADWVKGLVGYDGSV